MKDLISIKDMSKSEIEEVLSRAEEMEDALKRNETIEIMKGKILGLIFFEPSTRTKMSLTTAMYKLGGNAIGFEAVESSSVAKGENLTDTVRTFEKYSDVIAIRHPKEGTARYAAEISSKPVINAGDGSNQHPTQTLLDLYSIRRLKGKIEGLNITLLGDLKHARVMKPLAYALAMFNANLTFVSPMGLEFGSEFVEELKEKFNAKIMQTNDIYAGVRKADVLYVCRIQKERFADPYEAEKLQKSFKLTPEIIEQANDGMIILHALPKTVELDPKIDESKHAKYFEQMAFGIPIRMAILSMVGQ
jgi:aspartate carbamoyltransferase catalytic subunit